MSQGQVIGIFREAIMTAIKLSAPILIVSILIGLVIAIFQAATQIHEQTLTFVPKALGLSVVLIMLSSWMINVMIEFVQYIFRFMTLI
ncbi:MAG TPA: flagellar biosynthetic protein FliQ [Ruminococcaceae bacterium]|nr:flagellar biosynthetic protein FliQ [Oscillospiraceae bacterium]